jgi:hypothetical protein
MSSRDVHVHIEALVLEGFAPGDRARVADGVSRELYRLVAEKIPRAWHGGGETRSLVGRPITVSLGGPERTGELIASSIYDAATKGEAR